MPGYQISLKFDENQLKDMRADSDSMAFRFENHKKTFTGSSDIIDAILNAPIDLALLSKPDGTIVAINRSGADILHQPPDDLIGTRFFELLSIHEVEKRKAIFDNVIQTGKSASIDGQLDGKWFHYNIYPVFDMHGNVRRLAIFSYDITDQKKTELLLKEKENELKIHSTHLEELTATLKILLNKREQDKKDMERNLIANVKKLIEPFIEEIKHTNLDDRQRSLLNILESNIHDIISPMTRKLSMENLDLTCAEIRIANLIKHGHTSKEISKILNISLKTVETHRKNIRRKIGIDRKRANLRSYLLSIES
jgi:PAS domain S-box-containing protein